MSVCIHEPMNSPKIRTKGCQTKILYRKCKTATASDIFILKIVFSPSPPQIEPDPFGAIKDPSGHTIAKVALTWKRKGAKRGWLAVVSVFESDPVSTCYRPLAGRTRQSGDYLLADSLANRVISNQRQQLNAYSVESF